MIKEMYMRFPEGKAKALTLSYDDGVEQDVRLIEIMNKHGLKGTFNINSGCYPDEDVVYSEGTIHRRMPKSKVTALYKDSGHEVAIHGLTHPFLESLSLAHCNQEIYEDRKNLEEQFDCIVQGMAYPFGTYDDGVVDVLRMNGIVYARTVNSTGQFYIPRDLLRLQPTCHHNDERLQELTKRFVEETPMNHPYLFYLWGHSYEFEADDNWEVIETFAQDMSGHEDVWYATNIEIMHYLNAYDQLVVSMSGSKLYNPTATTLYASIGQHPVCIQPGETVDIS